MRKFLLSMAFFAALGASSVYAERIPERDRIIHRYDEGGVYRDSHGEYHWQIVERKIWVPTQRMSSIFGSRIIPGHYETQRQRIKIYHQNNRYKYNRYNQGRNGHPHGMPPGQRKKYNDRYGDYRKRDHDYRHDDNRGDDRRDRRRDDDL